MTSTRGHRHRIGQIAARVLTDPSPAMRAVLTEAAAEPELHLLARIAAHVPDLGLPELRVRHAATIAAVGVLGTGALDPLLEPIDRTRIADQLVAYILGALTAPPA